MGDIWHVNMTQGTATTVPATLPSGYVPALRIARERYEAYRALADAVTRLHEARDLYWGILRSTHGTFAEVSLAWEEWRAATDAVLAARAALDEGGPDGR